jgi:hypothetical protein
MSSWIRTLIALALAASVLDAVARAQYASCGTLEQGVTCPLLFRDTQGALWLLEDYGSFAAGDSVFVTGADDPSCFTFCMQGNGCIDSNTIQACDPTTGFCFCASGAPCGNTDASGGCASSIGQGALLTGSGSTSVAADDLTLHATRMPPNRSAIAFMGAGQASFPFGDGLRCVVSGGVGVFRFPIHDTGALGAFDEGPIVGTANALFPPWGHIAAGSTWYFQVWFRDPPGPCSGLTNVSNAVAATFTP